MSSIRGLVKISRLASGRRTITTSRSPLYRPQGKEKFKQLQEEMQLNDHLPVYRRKGSTDDFLFLSACALTAVSVGLAGHTFYTLIYPPGP